MINGNVGRRTRTGSGGDDYVLRLEAALRAFEGRERNRIGIDEARLAVKVGNAVAANVLGDEVRVGTEDGIEPTHERGDLHIVLQLEVEDVGVASQSGNGQCRFAERLAGNRAVVHAGAAHFALAFDEGDFEPRAGALDGRFLAARAGTDYDQVEFFVDGHSSIADTTALTSSFLSRRS